MTFLYERAAMSIYDITQFTDQKTKKIWKCDQAIEQKAEIYMFQDNMISSEIVYFHLYN